MPPRFRRHQHRLREQDDIASPEFSRLLFVAFGVALLLGMVSGALWIAYNVLRVQLF
jgi:hypothetical protein